jgi:hypothetical protein
MLFSVFSVEALYPFNVPESKTLNRRVRERNKESTQIGHGNVQLLRNSYICMCIKIFRVTHPYNLKRRIPRLDIFIQT